MARDGWKPGVVSLLDLVGIKKVAASGKGSALMRQMHALVYARVDHGLERHCHAYLWNDSILLLAYLNGEHGEKGAIVREVNELKRAVDTDLELPSYGIVVQGEMFPDDHLAGSPFQGPMDRGRRATVIKASSYAMANCFTIEAELKKHRKSWYIDTWVADELDISKPHVTKKVALLPLGKKRAIRMYSGSLW